MGSSSSHSFISFSLAAGDEDKDQECLNRKTLSTKLRPWSRSHQSGRAFASAGSWGRLSWWQICPGGWTLDAGGAECGPAHRTPPSPDSAGTWLHLGTAASSAPNCSCMKRRRKKCNIKQRRLQETSHLIHSSGKLIFERPRRGLNTETHSSALVFRASQWDQKCPKPKRTECYSRQLLGDCPDPPSHSCPILQSDLLCFWPDLERKHVLTRQKQQLIHKPALCCVPELQQQHPNMM